MSRSKNPQEYTIKGNKLVCPICSNTMFVFRETLMNTPAMTILSIEWANKQAKNYICVECGHILWFMKR